MLTACAEPSRLLPTRCMPRPLLQIRAHEQAKAEQQIRAHEQSRILELEQRIKLEQQASEANRR